MTPIDAGTIEQATKALRTASRHTVYPTLVSLICLLLVLWLIYKADMRNDVQVQAMQKIADHMQQEETWRKEEERRWELWRQSLSYRPQ